MSLRNQPTTYSALDKPWSAKESWRLFGIMAEFVEDAGGVFRAQEVLAKHDENYMPPEAAEALAKAQKGELPHPPKGAKK